MAQSQQRIMALQTRREELVKKVKMIDGETVMEKNNVKKAEDIVDEAKHEVGHQEYVFTENRSQRNGVVGALSGEQREELGYEKRKYEESKERNK